MRVYTASNRLRVSTFLSTAAVAGGTAEKESAIRMREEAMGAMMEWRSRKGNNSYKNARETVQV